MQDDVLSDCIDLASSRFVFPQFLQSCECVIRTSQLKNFDTRQAKAKIRERTKAEESSCDRRSEEIQTGLLFRYCRFAIASFSIDLR